MPLYSQYNRSYFESVNNLYQPHSNPSNTPANTNQSNTSANAPIPLTISLFLSQDMYPRVPFTPVTSLLFPFVKIRASDIYFVIIVIELLTIIFYKYASVYNAQNNYFPLGNNQGYPDMQALRQALNQRTPNTNTTSASRQGVTVTTAFDPPSGRGGFPPLDTPIFPRGLAFNIYLSSPLEASPSSNSAISYAFRLFEIRNLPGFLLLIIGLLIYMFLYPRLGESERRST